MKNIYSSIACGGMDVHHKFSNITFRNATGDVVRRERLEHPQQEKLFERFRLWPKGMPVVMEASFGWSWLDRLLQIAYCHLRSAICKLG